MKSPCARCCATSNPAALVQIQALERRVQELELGSARVTEERDSLREQLSALESSRQELAQEFIILKSNYLALGRELEQEVREAQSSSQSSSQLHLTFPWCAGTLGGFWLSHLRSREASHTIVQWFLLKGLLKGH